MVPMGMMGQGHDSTIIKDSMSELVIMESRPAKVDRTAAMEMLQEMMKGNQVNSIQAQNYMIPGQDPNGRKQRLKCSNCGKIALPQEEGKKDSGQQGT